MINFVYKKKKKHPPSTTEDAQRWPKCSRFAKNFKHGLKSRAVIRTATVTSQLRTISCERRLSHCPPHTQFVCWQVGIPPIVIAVDECKRVCSTTYRISPWSGKVLRVGSNAVWVTLCKWEKQHCESSKGERACLLIHNLEAWLERGHG